MFKRVGLFLALLVLLASCSEATVEEAVETVNKFPVQEILVLGTEEILKTHPEWEWTQIESWESPDLEINNGVTGFGYWYQSYNDLDAWDTLKLTLTDGRSLYFRKNNFDLVMHTELAP